MGFLVPVLVLASVAAGLGMVWRFRRGDELLQAWAAREGVQIVSADYCWFWRGPFWWRAGKDNSVYRIVVRTRDGRERSGYARCGSLWAGMFSSQVTVEWD